MEDRLTESDCTLKKKKTTYTVNVFWQTLWQRSSLQEKTVVFVWRFGETHPVRFL